MSTRQIGSMMMRRSFRTLRGENRQMRQQRGFHQSTSVIEDPLQLDRDFGKETMTFPRNRSEKGIDYELNWSLCADGVAPNANAFRNLDDKGLIMRSGGKLSKAKALVVSKLSSEGISVSENAAERRGIFQSVKEELSNVVDVFVHDGALASHPSYETRVRLVTDSPDLSLALKHMLVKVPLQKDARKQGNNVTMYVATGLTSGDAKAANAASDARADESGDVEIAVAGSPSFDALVGVLQGCARERLRDAIALRCSTYVDPSGGSVLVFSNDASAPVEPSIGSASLFGAHGNIWSESGIVRTFGGAMFESSVSAGRGDVVLGEGKNVASVQSVTADANVISHPSKVVFFSSKAKDGKISDMKTVRRYFEAAGHSSEDAASFESMLKKHNVRVFGAKTAAAAKKALA